MFEKSGKRSWLLLLGDPDGHEVTLYLSVRRFG
jgi:hypothetical protein